MDNYEFSDLPFNLQAEFSWQHSTFIMSKNEMIFI